MGVLALVFVSLNKLLPIIFSDDTEVILMTSNLLLFAAAFQLFDGTQVVAFGALRGLEDYKIPTYIALIGYWVIALPLCYLFAFNFKMEVYGVWLALSISLFFVAVFMFWRISYLLKTKFQF
jgi:MATE family multidrug resistance protein